MLIHGRWDKAREKQWVDMPAVSRLTFATSAANLVRENPQIAFCAIGVNKQRVPANLQRDSNKLYNSCSNLQFVDMLAGVGGTHYEFQESERWRMLRPHFRLKQLFF